MWRVVVNPVASSVGKSILDSLRAPKLSELSKRRTTRSNPPRGKKRSCSRSACDPKSVKPSQRVS